MVDVAVGSNPTLWTTALASPLPNWIRHGRPRSGTATASAPTTTNAARGRQGGRRPVVTPGKLERARSLLAQCLNVREAATRLKIGKAVLYDAPANAKSP